MDAGTVKATILTENSAPDGLECEHGFSVLIETDSGVVLFDAGESDMFARNAERLGIDLSAVDAIVLSHGHHDHAGGIPTACRLLPGAAVWMHPGAMARKFSRREEELCDAGVPEELANACTIRYVTDDESPLPGLWILPAPPSRYPLPSGNDSLYVESAGSLDVDPFEDEISLVVGTGDLMMLVTGCSHRGIANIVEACETRFPDRKLAVVVGGFHTKSDPPETLAVVAERLLDIPRIYAGHCTGDKAFAFLRDRLGDSVEACPVGTHIELSR